jgi:hypothetical protein
MRFALTLIFALLVGGSVYAQESSPVRPVDAIPNYVEYGDIRFRDEKAMLDHWASQFRLSPGSAIYIFAYSGRRACKGEAAARAVRAKNYLVKKHGIGADGVIWKDGGFRERLSVELWLRPRAETPPGVVPTVDPSEVEFIGGCQKTRGRRGKS